MSSSNGTADVWNVEMRDVGGYTIRLARTHGAPGVAPLLLFNGIGASLELVEPFARALARLGIGTMCFDIPGIGGSPPPKRPYRFGDMARLAADVLDTFSLPFADVAGVSWGGALAQEFVHAFPHRARRLVLCSTTAGSVAAPGKWSALRHMAIPRRLRYRRDRTAIGGELFGGRFRADPALFAAVARYLRAANGPGFQLQLLAGIGWTSVGWLHEIAAPTLVVAGTDDPIVPLFNAKLLASLIPKAKLYTIDDGHLLVVTYVEPTAKLVADFLA